MIIQVRGTSGCGKTTVVRRVMEYMGDWQAEMSKGRKKPLYYRSVSDWPLTLVLGHYESPCGGGDTIGSAAAINELILQVSRLHPTAHILVEGLLLSEDSKWTSYMTNPTCFFLTTPVEKCLEQIKGRREEAGNDKPLNPSNTVNRVKVIERARLKLLDAGVPCVRCAASQAPKFITDLLRRASNGKGTRG